MRQVEQAELEAAKAAVRAAPQVAEGWYALGRLMALTGATERAHDCFSRAVALDPVARQRPRVVALPAWLGQEGGS